MKYLNAAEVLPKELVIEIQKHISGEILYIPSVEKQKWGEKNGSKRFFANRNNKIKIQYQLGYTINQISEEFGLAYETVRKIVYKE
ncbi:CD3324 family protein [Anaerocolumna sp. MB42-C2]|uniref:CD3324 family protein n=1 Tax=Anaerocolumna sp. MB42-C2 TaxID=3070997 RepID=UPI0027E1D1C9|nr:CD3324 family protein [Anaerocolumna sp. MB42-C2]WMJ89046.1 CD3324 family protein [Anaerocolumna sp. MB42-C2]